MPAKNRLQTCARGGNVKDLISDNLISTISQGKRDLNSSMI
ncbi:hypothetical protein [Aureibacter tunicatorum]|uniref:Uncharacterized protein n=1 Tax=Aureibacter tunicatorum TaxID=866807 RepID=A0AAE3XMR3_9BACT|nr:hypothetical protein [Aureibacter tunicatorum]MDR6239317.1 hypothetical protein [Aureibacter tunicatorum]BDD04759.1 hypothetical protein AUTU_22420 [Aureibacter tunicatorum]